MKRVRRAAVVAFVLLTAACQGSFGTGPQIPNTIPSPNGQFSPQSEATQQPTPPPGTSETQSFALADATKGIPCPDTEGFGCVLRFNLPSPGPSPTGKKTPTPSPTPTPTPTPSPTPDGSASPGATPAPTYIPTVALTMSVKPSDAPKMVITGQKNQTPTTALVRISLIPSEDFTLNGPASATFVLPKDELGNRGFAVQLFEETVHKKHHDFKALFTLAKSSLSKETLTFNFTPPKITLPKKHHYLMILYGDQRANPTSSPAPSASPGSSGSPAATPSASPSLSPLPTGSAPPSP